MTMNSLRTLGIDRVSEQARRELLYQASQSQGLPKALPQQSEARNRAHTSDSMVLLVEAPWDFVEVQGRETRRNMFKNRNRSESQSGTWFSLMVVASGTPSGVRRIFPNNNNKQ